MYFLHLYSSYMPYPMPSFRFRHDANKIDPHNIWIDFIFVHVHKSSTLECSSFHHPEGIEWMSVRLISTITNLDEYKKIAITSDDVDLSTFYLEVTCQYCVPFYLEILYCNIFSLISDGASRRWQGRKVTTYKSNRGYSDWINRERSLDTERHNWCIFSKSSSVQ